MTKLISIIGLGLLFSFNSYAQQRPFGYSISGGGDVVSSVFLIQNGFVLDSAIQSTGKTYRFEYNSDGKLKRDVNFFSDYVTVYIHGRPTMVAKPGYRDYYYNAKGDVDSIAFGYWNDSVWVSDPSGGARIDYSYDDNGRILSEVYSDTGVVTYIEKHDYDSSGNPISDTTIVIAARDTTYWKREYDSQNRLTLLRTSSGGLYVYHYDSSGNVNYTIQHISASDTSYASDIHLRFDASGKLVEERRSDQFLPDSTWGLYYDYTFSFDMSGRMLDFGPYTWFRYDSDGNLDTLAVTHPVYSLFAGASLKDSYGNTTPMTTDPRYDMDVTPVATFYYSKLVTGVPKSNLIATTFALSQNFPNPFNPTTTITYSVPKKCLVTIRVYDVLGREIATLVSEEKHGGTYSVKWNAQNCASGVYFCRIAAEEFSKTQKMILLK